MKKIGELHPNSKLKSRDIPGIRQACKSGWGSIARCARKHGVDTKTIRQVLNGDTWKSVPE